MSNDEEIRPIKTWKASDKEGKRTLQSIYDELVARDAFVQKDMPARRQEYKQRERKRKADLEAKIKAMKQDVASVDTEIEEARKSYKAVGQLLNKRLSLVEDIMFEEAKFQTFVDVDYTRIKHSVRIRKQQLFRQAKEIYNDQLRRQGDKDFQKRHGAQLFPKD